MKAVAEVRTDGVQRGRGGFFRSVTDVPYISDPNGELVKSGPRKGEWKRLPYSSTSGFGTLIENRGSLEKWSERKVIEGLAIGSTVIDELFQSYHLCNDEAIRKTIADEIVARAKREANSMLAADRGTHAHLICELVDKEQSWDHIVADGEALGISPEQQQDIADAWWTMLKDRGLEVVAIEASVVDDEWWCAGTLDRIVRTTKPLCFALKSGEIIVIYPDTWLVLDIKSGSTRLTHAIQTCSYAKSQPYDTETETRQDWPFNVDQEHALIAHVDIDSGKCDLVYVDLVAGRWAGDVVVQAKAWERRTDVFSVAELPGLLIESAAELTPADQHATVESRGVPDEGDGVVDPTFKVPEEAYKQLSADGRLWITALTKAATQAGVPFHSSGNRTIRRYEIIRGLVAMATTHPDDDLVRALLEPVIGDCAQFPSVPVGHLLGSLSSTEAAKFATAADDLVAGVVALVFDDAGRAHIRTAHAA